MAFQASNGNLDPLLLGAAGSVSAVAVYIALIRSDATLAGPAVRWAGATAVCVAYWVTSVLGLQWTAVSGAGSPVWPAAEVELADLLLWEVRLWPAILIGRLAAAITTGSDQCWWAEPVIALANTGSATLPALLLIRWLPIDLRLTAMRDVVRLTIAIAAGGALAAVIGTGVLTLSSALDVELDPLCRSLDPLASRRDGKPSG